MKMPKRIYVKLEKDNDDEYLVAYHAPDPCDEDGVVLGVYDLVDIGTLHIEPAKATFVTRKK